MLLQTIAAEVLVIPVPVARIFVKWECVQEELEYGVTFSMESEAETLLKAIEKRAA